MRHLRVLALAFGLIAAVPAAHAQDPPTRPGPWVLDVRGVTLSLPVAAGFVPPVPSGTSLPSRGFGGELGIRWYGPNWGPSRIGVGAGWIWARGTTPEVGAVPGIQEVFTSLTPEVSTNFGTASGWSYVSLGVGTARIRTVSVLKGTTSEPASTGSVLDVHAGAGARWFTSNHLAVGFDVRLHRLSAGAATPSTIRLLTSVGFSLR
ncbi:MAG: hypothetical protein ABL971_02780 [Vicinamibacterales bacterium]